MPGFASRHAPHVTRSPGEVASNCVQPSSIGSRLASRCLHGCAHPHEEDEDADEVEDSMPLQNLDDVAVAVAAVVDKAASPSMTQWCKHSLHLISGCGHQIQMSWRSMVNLTSNFCSVTMRTSSEVMRPRLHLSSGFV